MAYGVKSLRQCQLSRELSASQGTAGATTDYTIWRGEYSLEDTRELIFPPEDVGVFGGTDRNYSAKTGGILTLTGNATFEQLAHVLDAAIALATPTTDASSAFIRTYTFPLVTSDFVSSTDLQTFSVKLGDNVAVDQAHYAYCSEFTLSGKAGEAIAVSATFPTRDVTSDSIGFVTVTLPNVEDMLISKMKLYIDPSTDAIGTTLKSGTLLDMSLKVTTGWNGKNTGGDGRTDFAFLKQTLPEITLEITFEHESSAIAEKKAWRLKQTRLIQLRCEGSSLTSPSTDAPYDTNIFIANLAGRWEKFGILETDDVGDDTVKGTFRVRYNSEAARFCQFILANQVAVMPG